MFLVHADKVFYVSPNFVIELAQLYVVNILYI